MATNFIIGTSFHLPKMSLACQNQARSRGGTVYGPHSWPFKGGAGPTPLKLFGRKTRFMVGLKILAQNLKISI